MISVTVDVDLPRGRFSLTEYVEASRLDNGTGDELAAMALLARLVRAVGARYEASITEALSTLRGLADAAGMAVGRTAPERDWSGELLALADAWYKEAGEHHEVMIAAQLRVCALTLRALVKLQPGEQLFTLAEELTDEQKRAGMLPEDMLS